MEQFFDIPKDVFIEFFNNILTGSHGDSANAGDVVEEAMSVGQLLGSAGMTVLIGLVVVIGTLLVLTGIFYLFGFIMGSADRKAKKAKEKAKAAAPAPAPAAAPGAPAPAVQDGIPGEVVAAIAAAVAMMAPEGKRYALKSVSRKDAGGRSAWAAAGIADNTRPF